MVQVLSARRHVGLQIDHHDALIDLPLSAIPQLLDEHTYRRHFAGMLTTQESTGRLYASLCIARATTARVDVVHCCSEYRTRPGHWQTDIASGEHATGRESFRDRGSPARQRGNYRVDGIFRALERRVIELASTPDTWFTDWARSASPRSARPHSRTR